MNFDEILAGTNDVFMDTFAERQMVIYRPANGLPRSIRAIIDRDPPAPVFSGEKHPTPYSLMITVPNDAITGIDHATFDPADRIDVPMRSGGPLVNRGFSAERAVVDAGMLTLKVV